MQVWGVSVGYFIQLMFLDYVTNENSFLLYIIQIDSLLILATKTYF